MTSSGALVHSHSPALTQLSTLAEVPGEALLFHASFWPDVVPIFEENHLVVDRRDAVRLANRLGDSPLVLMRWHGAVVGTTLEEAVFRSIQAEANAGALLTAMASGRPYIPLPAGCEQRKIAESVITARMLGLHRDYLAAQLSNES